MSSSTSQAEHWYRPNEKAPESGVYVVAHEAHRPEHEATLLAGETFPSCSICGDKVRFRLARSAASASAASS